MREEKKRKNTKNVASRCVYCCRTRRKKSVRLCVCIVYFHVSVDFFALKSKIAYHLVEDDRRYDVTKKRVKFRDDIFFRSSLRYSEEGVSFGSRSWRDVFLFFVCVL